MQACKTEQPHGAPETARSFTIKLAIRGPGWRGAEKTLSTVPTVDWVSLGFGKSKKRSDFGSLYLHLVCRRTLPRLAEKSM